jgi:superfamily II DNA or RNA helicase
MTRQLRDFQAEAVDSVREEWQAGSHRDDGHPAHRHGKTDVIAKLVTDEAAAGGRALVLAHRGELLDQISQRCGMHNPRLPIGRVQADDDQTRRPITVAMTPTLAKADRRERLPRPSLVVVDECHHITSPSNMAILEWAGCLDETDPTRLLGVTATPSRSDDAKRGIGMVLQSVAFSRDIAWAIRAGWLVPPRGLAVVTSHMDLDTAKLNRGDYQDRDLGEMVSQDVGEIVRAWQTYAVDADYPQGRITIAFTPTVAAAAELAQAFELAGVKAEAVLGSTKQPEREAVYARLAAGVTRVLVGVAVMTEGFDSPPVSCVLMARPTRSRTVYTQAVGRGLRLHPGKADCLVLDVVGSSRGQKLVTLAELHPGAPYDSTDPKVTRESLLEPAEKPGPTRLQGPATYAEVDLLGETVLRWLVTSQGVRFLVAGERVIYLWPDTNNPRRSATWSIITANLKGDHAQPGDVARDVPLTLEEATALAERHALELVPDLVAEQNRPWRTARVAGRSGQVTYARLLGIARPEAYTRGRLSDEMDVLMASARLAQAARWTA